MQQVFPSQEARRRLHSHPARNTSSPSGTTLVSTSGTTSPRPSPRQSSRRNPCNPANISSTKECPLPYRGRGRGENRTEGAHATLLPYIRQQRRLGTLIASPSVAGSPWTALARALRHGPRRSFLCGSNQSPEIVPTTLCP